MRRFGLAPPWKAATIDLDFRDFIGAIDTCGDGGCCGFMPASALTDAGPGGIGN